MRTDDFDFHLPERLIALRPAEPRDSARLLLVPTEGPLEDHRVCELPRLLRAGDALVFNDTRVIPARLAGVRVRDDGEARIEATLMRRLDQRRWTALARPAKRLRPGDVIRFGALSATVAGRGEAGQVELAFNTEGAALDQAIAREGVTPLPPYIASRRAADARDSEAYQTVYAREGDSVAAPTAGLHFTPGLLDALSASGVHRCFVTLHVGAGTFLPVKTDAIADHKMHAEWGEVSEAAAETLNAVRRAGGRIVCVGTTSLRLIESAADNDGRILPYAGETDIFITPGYGFRAVDGLMTNFHLPRSTLFMLVSAFSGLERMRAAYAHAVEEGYRFYSYGDASLLWRAA